MICIGLRSATFYTRTGLTLFRIEDPAIIFTLRS